MCKQQLRDKFQLPVTRVHLSYSFNYTYSLFKHFAKETCVKMEENIPSRWMEEEEEKRKVEEEEKEGKLKERKLRRAEMERKRAFAKYFLELIRVESMKYNQKEEEVKEKSGQAASLSVMSDVRIQTAAAPIEKKESFLSQSEVTVSVTKKLVKITTNKLNRSQLSRFEPQSSSCVDTQKLASPPTVGRLSSSQFSSLGQAKKASSIYYKLDAKCDQVKAVNHQDENTPFHASNQNLNGPIPSQDRSFQTEGDINSEGKGKSLVKSNCVGDTVDRPLQDSTITRAFAKPFLELNRVESMKYDQMEEVKKKSDQAASLPVMSDGGIQTATAPIEKTESSLMSQSEVTVPVTKQLVKITANKLNRSQLSRFELQSSSFVDTHKLASLPTVGRLSSSQFSPFGQAKQASSIYNKLDAKCDQVKAVNHQDENTPFHASNQNLNVPISSQDRSFQTEGGDINSEEKGKSLVKSNCVGDTIDLSQQVTLPLPIEFDASKGEEQIKREETERGAKDLGEEEAAHKATAKKKGTKREAKIKKRGEEEEEIREIKREFSKYFLELIRVESIKYDRMEEEQKRKIEEEEERKKREEVERDPEELRVILLESFLLDEQFVVKEEKMVKFTVADHHFNCDSSLHVPQSAHSIQFGSLTRRLFEEIAGEFEPTDSSADQHAQPASDSLLSEMDGGNQIELDEQSIVKEEDPSAIRMMKYTVTDQHFDCDSSFHLPQSVHSIQFGSLTRRLFEEKAGEFQPTDSSDQHAQPASASLLSEMDEGNQIELGEQSIVKEEEMMKFTVTDQHFDCDSSLHPPQSVHSIQFGSLTRRLFEEIAGKFQPTDSSDQHAQPASESIVKEEEKRVNEEIRMHKEEEEGRRMNEEQIRKNKTGENKEDNTREKEVPIKTMYFYRSKFGRYQIY